MSASIKKILKILIPIALGTFLVWYSYYSTSEEDRKNIYESIINVDFKWVLLSIFIGVLSHFSRAIRWVYLLKPLGYKPKLYNSFLIVLISYFANILIIRSGEFLRATALSTYEKIPFEKGFGTIVTERIIDVLMLLIIIVVSLFLQTEIILELLNKNGIGLFGSLILLFVGIIGLAIGIKVIKKSKSAFAIKIKNFLSGMLEGVLSILKMKNKGAFIFHSIFIWVCYIAMFWVIKFTVLETIHLPLGAFLVAFVAGAFAMAATNGGLGLFPIAVSTALLVYDVDDNAGKAYGWIMWTAQTAMVIVFGTISFVLLPLFNRNR